MELSKQIEHLQKDVKEVKDALLGNEYNPNGFAKRVEKLEEYQQKDKKHKWTLAGIGLAIGFFIKLLIK